jgi:hypothetical protein
MRPDESWRVRIGGLIIASSVLCCEMRFFVFMDRVYGAGVDATCGII